MAPGWQPTADSDDRVVAERSGSVAGVAPQEPPDVLVGRARELTAITAAMAAARRGAQRVAHLVGEAGIGKTALAEHAAALASGQGWVVAWGRAWDAGATPPYWLWQQVLGSLVRATDVSTRVHPATVAWLVDLIPELAGTDAMPPAPALDPDRARVGLHRAVVHLLGAAAADRPLLIVLDDVHDADAASLALATLVCRSLPDSLLLVVTTQRPVGAGIQATTAALLGQLNQQGALVPVGALDQAAVAAQAAALAGTQLAPEEAAWLHRASGGNPFFVDQLVRWSATREGAAVLGELPISVAVRQVVGERLAALGADARQVVTVAAVAGDEVDQQVLATVAGLPLGRFADAVAEAVAAGILWRRSSEHPACGFVHTLLREAAAAAVDAAVRRGLHLELAGALEALPARHGGLAEVAHHRRAALPAGDPQAMVDRTEAAAEEALRVFAHEAAVAQCTAGLTAIGPYRPGSAVQRWQARLLCLLGEAYLHAGDPTRARQTLVEAQALATGADDSVLAADAAVRMPRLTQFLVPDRELESLLTKALEALGNAAPALRARLLARRAVIAEDDEDRRAHSDAAVEAARQLGDPTLLAEVLSAGLYVLWAPDTAEERLATSTQIIELAVQTGDVRRELDGRMWRLISLLEFGRVAEAEMELGRYEQVAERVGQPEFLFFARSRRSTLAALPGRFEEARALFPAGLSRIDLGREPGPSRWLVLMAVAEVAYQLGDADAARSVRDELAPYSDRFIVAAGAVGCGGAVSRLLGLCALTLDQLDDAVGWLRAAVASNRRIGAAPFVARAQAELATALRRRAQPGDAEEARQLLAEAAKAAAELGMAVLAGDIAELQAEDAEAGPDRPRLRRDGEDWLLTVGARTTRLRHSKGLRSEEHTS